RSRNARRSTDRRGKKEDAHMRTMTKAISALALGILLAATAVAAESAGKYQVTGPTLEVTGTMIAEQKGKDRWEGGRDAGTKVNGELKVGSKVTIKYRMVATTVDVKAADTKASTSKKKAAGK